MFRLRARGLKIALAALCVALTAVLVGQVPVAAVDQAHHRLGLDHAASALAGQVFLEVDDHAAEHDHGQQIAMADQDDGDLTPPHHHGDGPQVAALAAEVDATVLLRQSAAHLRLARPSPPGLTTIGLKRPPRGRLETFA